MRRWNEWHIVAKIATAVVAIWLALFVSIPVLLHFLPENPYTVETYAEVCGGINEQLKYTNNDWRDAHNNNSNMLGRLEGVIPPGELEEYHQAQISLRRVIKEIIDSKERDDRYISAEVTRDERYVEEVEKIRFARDKLNPETLAMLRQHGCESDATSTAALGLRGQKADMLMEKYDVPLIIMPLTGEFLLTGDEYEHAHGIHCSEEVFKDSLVDYVTLWYGLAILYPEFYVELYRETGLPHKLLDEGSQCQEAFDIAMEIYVDRLTEFAALSGTAEPSNNLGR